MAALSQNVATLNMLWKTIYAENGPGRCRANATLRIFFTKTSKVAIAIQANSVVENSTKGVHTPF